ncbi:hypothetical protein [Spirosoma sp. KNUC1025]|uniref:hypothetical protein n=1 Tax=Spirosoma sp. KNUC1025 TaxID=2894082 RepID=UPI0038667898|nr:hypothetical protein LN737_25995 [Spirosoma sp. KNUC1025]
MAVTRRKVVVSLDTYLSILAVVSSFCAIGITFYQAYLQRTEQYASVMPILRCLNTSKLENGLGYAFICVNNGLGPAFIEEATYTYQGKTYESIDNVVHFLPVDSTLNTSNVGKGWVIPQGERVDILQISTRKNIALYRGKIGNGGLTVNFVYRSVYGQRWRMTYPSDPDESNVELN